MRSFAEDRSGSVAIEFVGGFLLLLVVLFGIMAYGEVFFTQIQLGNIAGDAARDLVVARNATDRDEILVTSKVRWLDSLMFPDCGKIEANAAGATIDVVVSYNFVGDSGNCRIVPAMPMIPLPENLSAKTTISIVN